MEPRADGYEVAWKRGADEYVLWIVDSDGNWLSQSAVVSGTSPTVQSLEPGFHQDLNGDGSIASTTVIEASGSTVLESVANVYLLPPADGSLGPQLSYHGALVTPGQFGGWMPIAAERTPGGYEVAWKMGVDQYILWDVDSDGHWLSQGAVLSGASAALQSREPGFHQDLNGDGSIPSTTVIEASGSTVLESVASVYLLSAADGSLGPQLSYNGALVTPGQFGGWAPIAAERTPGGYEVAWKMGVDQYILWDTDSSGHWLSQSEVMSGASSALQTLEAAFQQDLNGDGSMLSRTVIEAFGSTALAQIANGYLLSLADGSSGPSVKHTGAAVTAGQFDGWTPIAAEQAGSGYRMAWKMGADQYVLWTTDGDGNWQAQSAFVPGISSLLQSAEPGFHQDLNGDGTIGLHTTAIESSGATALSQFADTYLLSGTSLKFSGAVVTAGQFAGWTPIGAEQAAGGYEVAWKMGADQYVLWAVDGNGNWLSQSAFVPGISSLLQSAEPGFHQDLNGDGTIGLHTTVIESSGATALSQLADTYLLSGTSLKFSGAVVTAGQFAGWTPIAAEQAAGGYEVAWKMGADQYVLWAVDGNGNWLSQSAVLSGASAALVSHEADFHQDLNDDGTIGSPPSLLLADTNDPFR